MNIWAFAPMHFVFEQYLCCMYVCVCLFVCRCSLLIWAIDNLNIQNIWWLKWTCDIHCHISVMFFINFILFFSVFFIILYLCKSIKIKSCVRYNKNVLCVCVFVLICIFFFVLIFIQLKDHHLGWAWWHKKLLSKANYLIFIYFFLVTDFFHTYKVCCCCCTLFSFHIKRNLFIWFYFHFVLL